MTPVEKQTVELHLRAYPDEVLQIIGKYLSEHHNSLPPPPPTAIHKPRPYKTRARRVLTPPAIARIMELRTQKGLSAHKIAAQLRLNPSTVLNAVNGIPKNISSEE